MPKISIICLFALVMSTTVFAKELPSQFEDNLIFFTPKLKDGTELRVFTDTGGGLNIISKDLSDKYGWPIYEVKDGDSSLYLTDMPEFTKDSTIPMAGLNNFLEGRLAVMEMKKLRQNIDYDVLLGGRWHAEKIIDFDYPSKRVSHLDALPDITKFNKISLGFQKNDKGSYTTAFPSIDIEVEGQAIPMLFDTGASAWPSEQVKELLRPKHKRIASSFIASNIFDKWVEDHSDWLVIENGCMYSKESMIRVPEIKIGDKIVGPVWFTRRPDRNFHDFMSKMMDRRVEGALGGSALQYVRVIVDYPSEVAYIANEL